MPQVSDKFSSCYRDSYSGGAGRAWRDAGALYKGANVVNAWAAVDAGARPRVIELGCGEGALAASLSGLDFFSDYRGYDLSPSGITEAIAREIPKAQFAVIDGATVPASDDSADLAILSHVVEHLEHPRQLIYEATRLAPWVLVEVPLEHHLRTPRDYKWSSLGHINLYTATSIRQLVQSCDLAVIWQKTTQPGADSYFFEDRGLRRRLSFAVKNSALRGAPALARQLFTFHETILARRTGLVG